MRNSPLATKASNRPVSPHLMHVKWPINMVVSIIHRATGSGMATVGAGLLVWWLAALAAGKEAYATFIDVFTYSAGGLNAIGYVFGIGLTWSLFQHMATGIRHFFLDAGANYDLKNNRLGAWITVSASATATILFWAFLIMGKH